MAKEYLFSCPTKVGFQADNNFDVTIETNLENKYLVSNIPIPNTEIYAPEINFYYENSDDTDTVQCQKIKNLYEARALSLENSQAVELSVVVGKKVIIVSKPSQVSLLESLTDKGFSCKVIDPSLVLSIVGHIGKLSIKTDQDDGTITTDQVIWFGAPIPSISIHGVHVVTSEDSTELVAIATRNSGEQFYLNHKKYDTSSCLYNQKRGNSCKECVDICPTNGIVCDPNEEKIVLSELDCQSCGRCLCICPSGALDSAHMPRSAFAEISKLYEASIAFMVSDKVDLSKVDLKLEKNLLPFVINDGLFLDEAHLLTLLQSTGNPIIIYTDHYADQITEVFENIVQIVNEIFLKKYARNAIYVCKNQEELSLACQQASPFSDILYSFDEQDLQKREIFSNRLANFVGDSDYGVIETGPHIHYGSITINQDACTLCLSCVDACQTGALTSSSEDNSLRYNSSICTQCGHCENTCPEAHCLHVVHDKLALKSNYFSDQIMATDELFECIECGTGFAPKKSISKIANMMAPIFSGDSLRMKSLSCCPDCKARVMLEALSINDE